MKPDHERVTKLLTDTVTLLCKNGLSYDRELRIQGLLGITVDSNEVILVTVNDFFCCSSDSTVTSAQSTVADSASGTDSSQSSKRSVSEDVVDLTRLVETPNIAAGVQRSPQLPSSISPILRGTQTRPRSTGSVSQTRMRAVAPNLSNVMLSHHHSQPAPRQLAPVTTAVTGWHRRTSSSGRNSAERSASTRSQLSSALAFVDSFPGQRPPADYADSVRNLMLSCDRQLPPQQGLPGQHHRQHLPAAADWVLRDQHHTVQRQPVHHQMAEAGDTALPSVARRGTEHIHGITRGTEQPGIPQPLLRQPVVPAAPDNACVRRGEGDSLHYMCTNTVSQPAMLSRQHVHGVLRLYSDDRPPPAYYESMQQGRQLVNSEAYFHPPAKRHASGHPLRQAVQPYNPALMQTQPPHAHGGCFTQSCSTLSRHQTLTGSLALNAPPLSDVSAGSCVTSSPAIKPPSSPLQTGRRSRPRQVEHIDLCGDDETADSGIHISVSSIVIQPDNTDLPTAPNDARQSDVVSANTSDFYDNIFEPAPETGLLENDLPPLSRIHEIVPVDDGVDSDAAEASVVENTVAAETAMQPTAAVDALFIVPIETGEPSDSAQSNVSNRLSSEPSSAPEDIGLLSTFPRSQTGVDLESARLSADESQQMTALYFDTEDSDMHAQM